ncbi:MAG: hypothetical protein IPH62_19405 [Ignavibacteriae bacterium]|nr:hypothetical protein [Ignavibacteriota bacterium]
MTDQQLQQSNKQYYFNGIQSNILIYKDNIPIKLEISTLLDMVDCTLENEVTIDSSKIKNWKINEEIYIDSLNANGEVVLSKINYLIQKEGESNNCLYEVDYNNEKIILSNIAIYDKKKEKVVVSPLKNIEQKFIIQNINHCGLDNIDNLYNLKFNYDLGFIVGSWIVSGGFSKIEKTDEYDYLSFKRKEPELDFISNIISRSLSDSTSFKKKTPKNFDILLVVNNNLQELISDKFKFGEIPLWLLSTDDEFIKGIFYSFIFYKSYLSKDKKNNEYLVLLNKNRKILEDLSYIMKRKFGIYSKFTSNNENSLSFKFNDKLLSLIKEGIENKLIVNFNTSEITNISPLKEYFIKGYKIIPWYKIKINTNNKINETFSLKLNQNKIFMLSNGTFVLG